MRIVQYAIVVRPKCSHVAVCDFIAFLGIPWKSDTCVALSTHVYSPYYNSYTVCQCMDSPFHGSGCG